MFVPQLHPPLTGKAYRPPTMHTTPKHSVTAVAVPKREPQFAKASLRSHPPWDQQQVDQLDLKDELKDRRGYSWVQLKDNNGTDGDVIQRSAPLQLAHIDHRRQGQASRADVPTELALTLLTAVVTAAATVADVAKLLEKTVAGILVLIWDPLLLHQPAPPRDCEGRAYAARDADAYAVGRSHQELRREFEVAVHAVVSDMSWTWGRTDLKEGTGIVLYQTRVVDKLDVVSFCADDTHVMTVLEVTMREWSQNPGAQFRMGVPARYRFSRDTKDGRSGGHMHSTWSEIFCDQVIDDQLRHEVRILTGFFDCNERMLIHIGCSGGLTMGDKPFHTAFRVQWGDDASSLHIHANVALVLGSHDPRHPVYGDVQGQEAVLVPEWLKPIAPLAQVEFGSSWLQRFAFCSLPTWDPAPMEATQLRQLCKEWAAARFTQNRDPVEAGRNDRLVIRRKEFLQITDADYNWNPLQNLGKASSKRLTQDTFEQHWVRGIHQNMVFIGHGRQSRGSKQTATDNYWKKRYKKNSRSGG